MIQKRFEELRLSGSLPSPSGVGLTILRITQRDDFSIEELSRAIQADPALTGRVLKLSNSAHVAPGDVVTTVPQAVLRLGARTVRNVALGFTLVTAHRSGHCRTFDYERYWATSLAGAVAGQALAEALGGTDAAEAFTCTLLSRIGMLALACVYPERYDSILERVGAADARALAQAEIEAFEIDHREVASALMSDWGLPAFFTQSILRAGAESLEADVDDAAVVAMVRILRGAADIAEHIASHGALLRADDPELLRRANGLGVADPASLAQRVASAWAQWCELLRVPDAGLGVAPGPGPLLRGGDEAAAEPVPERDAPSAIKVLVADDDPRMVRLLTYHLRREGYQVATAVDGREALEAFVRETPEIVITDWAMPRMDGLELCRALRCMEAGRKTYVLVLTAREAEDQVVEAFHAGVDDYVAKPFNPRIMLARVRAGRRMIELQQQVESDKRVRMEQVAEMGLLTRKLRAAALTDVLTELPNRRHGMTLLHQEWLHADVGRRPLCVIMVDIDHFKQINDEHGHDVGDRVLREVADVLRSRTRGGDVVCRLGGEEFLVINVNSDLEGARRCAERLRASVEQHVVRFQGFEAAVTISLGIAALDADTPSVDALLKEADDAVYRAKSAGRNTIRVAREPGPRADRA